MIALIATLLLAAPPSADALVEQASAEAMVDADMASATLEKALALQQMAQPRDDYAIAKTRTLIAVYRAFAGDRAGQIDPMAAGAAAMAGAADTPARREEAAVAIMTVAQFMTTAGRHADADERLGTGLALLARPDTRQGRDAAEAFDIAADVAARRGDFPASLDHARRAAGIAQAAGLDGAARSRSLGNMAGALIRLGRMDEAEPVLLRALESADAADEDARPYLLQALQKLADFYARTGRAALAEPLLRRALTLARTLPRGFRYEYPVTVALASLLLDRGDAGPARMLAGAAADRASAMLGAASPENGALLILLARTELALGRVDAARTAAERANAIYTATLPADDPRRGDALAAMAAVRLAAGDAAGATLGYRAALAAMANRAAGDPERAAAEMALADALSRDPATAAEGWRLARDTADRLTARLADLGSVAGRDADLAPGDRRLFDRSVSIAWARRQGADADADAGAGGGQ